MEDTPSTPRESRKKNQAPTENYEQRREDTSSEQPDQAAESGQEELKEEWDFFRERINDILNTRGEEAMAHYLTGMERIQDGDLYGSTDSFEASAEVNAQIIRDIKTVKPPEGLNHSQVRRVKQGLDLISQSQAAALLAVQEISIFVHPEGTQKNLSSAETYMDMAKKDKARGLGLLDSIEKEL